MIGQRVRLIKRGRYRDGMCIAADDESVTVQFADDPITDSPAVLTFSQQDVEVVVLND